MATLLDQGFIILSLLQQALCFLMASTSSFVPKGQQELLLRTPLTFGFAPTNYEPTSSLPAKVRRLYYKPWFRYSIVQIQN